MVLTRRPLGEPAPDVEVRPVETLEQMREAQQIAHVAFELPAEALDELLRAAEDSLTADGRDGATFLAYVDERPVARATAMYTDHGVLLFGAATLPDARGRGAYRALVRARWDVAVRRGTPVLVTHAGAMSRPILRRLGFDEIAEIRILLDEFAR